MQDGLSNTWLKTQKTGNGLARMLKVTHINGRLLDQAMILLNCIPFQMETSLKEKNLLPEEVNSFLYEQFLIVWKIIFITLIVTIFITHKRNLRNGCYANDRFCHVEDQIVNANRSR